MIHLFPGRRRPQETAVAKNRHACARIHAVDTKLAPLFLAGVKAGADPALDGAALEPLLQGLLFAGHAAWPGLRMAAPDFVQHLSWLCRGATSAAAAQTFLLAVNYPED